MIHEPCTGLSTAQHSNVSLAHFTALTGRTLARQSCQEDAISRLSSRLLLRVKPGARPLMYDAFLHCMLKLPHPHNASAVRQA